MNPYNRNRFVAVIASSLMAFASSLFAQTPPEDFTVAGGGGAKNGSTYSQMLGEFSGSCSTESMTLTETNTNGGVQNLGMIRSNKVKAAIVPTDLLLAAKQENPASVAQIKTLFPMHPEEVHMIARAGVKKEGGLSFFGSKPIGGTDVEFKNVEDLKGRPLGAVGGSVESAKIINGLLKLGSVVTPYPTNKDLQAALTSGQIDAAVIVAGAPSAFVASLPARQFKLLTLRANSDLSAVYTMTKLQYDNLGGGETVDTIATQALFVTRTFSSPEMLKSLALLRKCFYDNIGKLKDKTGTHPKWQDVSTENRGRWEWYELPNVSAHAAPSKKK